MTEEKEIHYREGGLRLWVDVCQEVAKNTAMAFPQVRAWRMNRPRAFTLDTDLDGKLERYAFYPLRQLQGILGNVKGLHIAEIGPGDFVTSGLALLAAGAASYTFIDRFVGDLSKPEAKTWYGWIHEAWPRFFPELKWPDYLKVEDFPEAYKDRVEVLPVSIEEIKAERLYDVVCSFQVGEHVEDIESFAQMNSEMLKPGGVAVHRVDFGPHDCWCYYRDPLTFLRFPHWLWRLMGSNRATANRRRYHEFCAAWEKAGLKVDVASRDYFQEDRIEYSRLNKMFRDMPLESLSTGTAIFVCRK
jgi:hypothetical protein